MSNTRYPTGPAIARRGPLRLNEYPPESRRQAKARWRRSWVRELACRWDARQGRDRGCHVRVVASYAHCPTHPAPEPVNYRGRGA